MTYIHERTWCHYFKKIADGLPRLQHFRFGEEMFREVSPQSIEYLGLLLPQKRYLNLVGENIQVMDARFRSAEAVRTTLEMRKDEKAFMDLHQAIAGRQRRGR